MVTEGRKQWHRPKIRPLMRLGEMTTPTTVSASNPNHHRSNLAELREHEAAGK